MQSGLPRPFVGLSLAFTLACVGCDSDDESDATTEAQTSSTTAAATSSPATSEGSDTTSASTTSGTSGDATSDASTTGTTSTTDDASTGGSGDGTGSTGTGGTGTGGLADAGPGPFDIFARDDDTLALFEFNGTTRDSSGFGRDAVRLSPPSFSDTRWGQGLSMAGTDPQGLDWSAHASMLTRPYTIEMVLTPATLDDHKKLFSPGDGVEDGYYYNGQAFESFPFAELGSVREGELHYFAIVATTSDSVEVFLNGVSLGTTKTFTSPPAEAIFFRDDSGSNRNETFSGSVDAMRLSSVARTKAEITAVQDRIAAGPAPLTKPN